MMIAARFASLALAFMLMAGLSSMAHSLRPPLPRKRGDAGTPPIPAAQQFSVNQPIGDWPCAVRRRREVPGAL
jgi:hypothetical protein